MNQLEQFRQIKAFVFDVDGVLTNNEVLILEDGKLLRKMSIRDGYAIKRAVQEGYRICVITGGNSEGVRERLQDLGVTDIYMDRQDKMEAYEDFIDLHELDEGTVLYMGDDIPDYPVMRKVGLPACPVNAAPEVLQIAQYVSPYQGGEGCARDVIEKVLRLQGKWPEGPW
jgi:3-deoxy-D-manno-octulosonate 8-phosphate phosphatase (KDO 8-P phosphatase)